MLQLLGLIVLIILFLTVIYAFGHRYTERSLLTGFWHADPSFCEDAGIDSLVFYFGEPNFTGSKLSGYVLMTSEDGILINNPVDFTLSSGYSVAPYVKKEKTHTLTIDWFESEGYDFFPSVQTMTFYPELGKIILYDRDQVYAILYKNNIMSDVTRVVPDQLADTHTADQPDGTDGTDD